MEIGWGSESISGSNDDTKLIKPRSRRHSTTLVVETVGAEGVGELALIWLCCTVARGYRLVAEDIRPPGP